MQNRAFFRFYEELNDFLPPNRRKETFEVRFDGRPAVKDIIESLGVPHTEVDLIIVDGQSVGFDWRLEDGDRVAVYPIFESLDITPILRLRPEPLRKTRFVLDVNLGKLAHMLRLLGFDAAYRNDWDDPTLVRISVDEKRILLTTDRHLLKRKIITHGYWVRNRNPQLQIRDVITRFDLGGQIRPFTRCTVCNHPVETIPKAAVLDCLPEKTARRYDVFSRCEGCRKIYWKGSHWEKMQENISRWTQNPG